MHYVSQGPHKDSSSRVCVQQRERGVLLYYSIQTLWKKNAVIVWGEKSLHCSYCCVSLMCVCCQLYCTVADVCILVHSAKSCDWSIWQRIPIMQLSRLLHELVETGQLVKLFHGETKRSSQDIQLCHSFKTCQRTFVFYFYCCNTQSFPSGDQ